jgi:hypothetical protein
MSGVSSSALLKRRAGGERGALGIEGMEEMVGRINCFGNYVIDPDPMPEPLEQHLSLSYKD